MARRTKEELAAVREKKALSDRMSASYYAFKGNKVIDVMDMSSMSNMWHELVGSGKSDEDAISECLAKYAMI